MVLWEGDTVNVQNLRCRNVTVTTRCGSDLGRDTKAPAQNIAALVAMTGFFRGKNMVKDHVRRRYMV